MPTPAERLYRRLSGDEDGAPADGITDAAAKVVPRNFVVQLVATVATKTGDQLFSPRLVLTWLLAGIGAPAAAVGLLVPVREGFALLPQAAAGVLVQRSRLRKRYWIAGSFVQGLSVLLILGAVLAIPSPAVAGWATVALLALFSCARVFNSISGKDLRGKTLPKGRRGLAGGTASAVAGAATLAVAAYFVALQRGETETRDLAWVLVLAAGLWWLGATAFAALREYPSEPGEDRGSLLAATLDGFGELREDRAFRRFVVVRSCLVGNALVLPLVVYLAFDQSSGSGLVLGTLIGGSGLAAMVSGFTWGRFADRSSRRLLAVVGTAGAALCVAVTAAGLLPETGALRTVLLALLFFLLAVVHQGTRIGRKTYLIDLAGPGNRATLVAVSNTVVGGILLLAGALVGAVAAADTGAAVLLCGGLSGTAAVLGRGLPEAGKESSG